MMGLAAFLSSSVWILQVLLSTAASILDMSSVFEHDIESSATPRASLCHQEWE